MSFLQGVCFRETPWPFPQKKMYLQHWFLVVICIYLNRFDWINGRKIVFEFLCKNWLWVIFTKTLSSSRIEFKYLQIFGFGFNHFLFSCFTHRCRIFFPEDMIHVNKISDCLSTMLLQKRFLTPWMKLWRQKKPTLRSGLKNVKNINFDNRCTTYIEENFESLA